MSNLMIAEGVKVTLHFAVKMEDGHVVDSTFDEDPATLVVGDGNLLPGFEDVLIGLSAGDKQVFTILPEKGFGQHNPGNVQTLARSQFDEGVALEKGLVLSFSDPQNDELPGVVTDFDDKEVTVDFNHPLAGKNVEFDVEIITVEAVTTH